VAGRYDRPRRPKRSENEWHSLARVAVLALLKREHAVTITEMEAKLSDRTYDAAICPDPINPHHLVTARHSLSDLGEIEEFTATTKSKDESGTRHRVSTWSLPRIRGRKTVIDQAAERKRALMSRWLSWGTRNLLGEAGEAALAAALDPAPMLTRVSGSTRTVLGVPVDEVDNTAVYVAEEAGSGLTAIQLMFAVKNRREHYYASADDVVSFLKKAAKVQHARADQLVLPIFVCRRRHYTLWQEGEEMGFLPVMVMNQLVRRDPDLHTEEWGTRFGEVRDELLPDLTALAGKNDTSNRHRGIVNKLIPKQALDYARLWGVHYHEYL
jgi:hypothetical protein